MTYLDDIIIFSGTEEQHLAHIEEIFKRLEAADLKMKRSKCDFFKKHIHYLGHLISADGIRPLKDKLDSIRDMPAPCNSKEVKQFLGLVGYYRKFVPCFAALSRPLSKLTCKDKVFEWTQECKKAFAMLKEKLCAQPILQYADTTKGYTLYTDASKYGWAGVLTQLHTTIIDGKTITTDHPVVYVSGLFRGSQINWAALTKEAYAIYMSVKKLSFYLTDAEKPTFWQTRLVVWWTLTLTPDWIWKMQDGNLVIMCLKHYRSCRVKKLYQYVKSCLETMSSYQILTCRNPSHNN